MSQRDAMTINNFRSRKAWAWGWICPL